MMNASEPESRTEEPPGPRSLAAVAAALATCAHAEQSPIGVAGERPTATWCAACGALRFDAASEATWQAPALTSRLAKKHFEDLVLLLHATVQLAQLARAHAAPAAAHVFLRTVRASLAELARLPVVRDVDVLEQAIAAMPSLRVLP